MIRLLACAAVVGLAGCAPEEAELGSTGGSFYSSTRNTPVASPAPLTTASVVELADGRVAVTDPEADAVFIARLEGKDLVRIDFPVGSQPARLIEANGELVVALRGSGQLARLPVGTKSGDVDTSLLERACSEPRGVAYDTTNQQVKVACASGELVSFGATGRSVLNTGLELRDVMIINGATWVTTFRDAELIELDANGTVKTRLQPPPLFLASVHFVPHVAWRAIADGTRVVMVHQHHVVEEVSTLTNPGPSQPYYGTPYCTASVVSSALTVFDTEQKTVVSSEPLLGAVPLDVAVNGSRVAVTLFGSGTVVELNGSKSGACLYPAQSDKTGAPMGVAWVKGEKVWFDHDGRLFHRADEVVELKETKLQGIRTMDAARNTFHAQSPSGVACASCHPEGYDDGHTWQFGSRTVRSQTLEGGLLSTAPYHWDGHLRSVGAVLDETFVTRMGGLKPDTSTVNALSSWLDSVPARAPGHVNVQYAKVGKVLFEQYSCASCHSGDEMTNGSTVDVGTGGKFQVPTLRALRWRGPWMHDGCATTLAERFSPSCGGSSHGARVAAEDVAPLVEYLKTL